MSVCLLEIPSPGMKSNAVELWADSYDGLQWVRIDNNDDDSVYLSRDEAIQIAEAILEWGRE